MVKIGILREEKVKTDMRVPFSPDQCKFLQEKFNIKIYCQSSKRRCFSDNEYRKKNIEVLKDISNCDIFFGVKEIDENKIISGKKYFFFSHTIKEQEYNRDMIKEIVKQKVTLIDYECIKNKEGKRLVAFGKLAGIVGAYNAILGYGKKLKNYKLKRCFEFENYNELKKNIKQIKLPKMKIAVLGNGKVAKGCIEILKEFNIVEINRSQLVNEQFQHPVFCQLIAKDYYIKNDDNSFAKKLFYNNPTDYKSNFEQYFNSIDILINATYWNEKIPRIFTLNEMKSKKFKIKVIADISCDIEGLIPCTLKSTTIESPFYDYNISKNEIQKEFESDKNVTIMAIDNLPSELPVDASINFGKQLIKNVINPLLNKEDKNRENLINATITKNGKLTPNYLYLKNFINENK